MLPNGRNIKKYIFDSEPHVRIHLIVLSSKLLKIQEILIQGILTQNFPKHYR